MPRDGMPRAYLRIDPNIDQTIPDLDTFIRLMCAAARQPERGRFRDRSLLNHMIGRAKVAQAMTRGDVVTLGDGRLYVQGWDEWQEGDYTVTERMKRMRSRRAASRNGRDAVVTPPASPHRNDVTTDAVSSTSIGTSSTGDGVGDDSPPNPPPSGGRRSEGTSPRQLAAAAKAEVDERAEGKRYRRNQRALAYARGAISEDQQADMDRRDAPLSEIPDRVEHQKSLSAEDDRRGVEL